MPVEYGIFSLGALTGGAVVAGISHLLAKSRDGQSRHAKDFNEVAGVLAEILTKEKNCPSQLADPDFFAFRRVLGRRELPRFDQCIVEYQKVKKNAEIAHVPDESDSVLCRIGGSGWYRDAAPIVASIDKLLEFTKRK